MLATPTPSAKPLDSTARSQPSHIVNVVEASSPLPAGTLEDMDRPIGIPSNPNDESPRKAVLALVAHDEKKDDLLRLAKRYRSSLTRLHLLATSHTGTLLSEEVGLPVERFRSGPEGGDMQIGARIVQGDVDAVVFLRDPRTAHPHEPDIQALLKVCDVHGVPVATNLASAEILLRSLSQAIWWGRDAAAASHA
jgi:methylglyoxal synthase